MPHIVSTLEFAARAKDRTWQMMTRVYEQAARVINGSINIGRGWNSTFTDPTTKQIVQNVAQPLIRDNQQGALVYCTFAAANTNTSIQHKLGYIPRCYIPLWKAVACDVYDAPLAAPTNQPGLGLNLVDADTLPDGTNPTATTGVTTQIIILRCTVATNVLLLIF
jgi:hypothetical protein